MPKGCLKLLSEMIIGGFSESELMYGWVREIPDGEYVIPQLADIKDGVMTSQS